MQLQNARTYRPEHKRNTMQISIGVGIEVFRSFLLVPRAIIEEILLYIVTVEIRNAQYPYLQHKALDNSSRHMHGLTLRMRISRVLHIYNSY